MDFLKGIGLAALHLKNRVIPLHPHRVDGIV